MIYFFLTSSRYKKKHKRLCFKKQTYISTRKKMKKEELYNLKVEKKLMMRR